MSVIEKLLPCPMYGGEAVMMHNSNPDYGHWFYVECSNCELHTSDADHEYHAAPFMEPSG